MSTKNKYISNPWEDTEEQNILWDYLRLSRINDNNICQEWYDNLHKTGHLSPDLNTYDLGDWSVVPTVGKVSDKEFFNALKHKEFFVNNNFRDISNPDSLEEPDKFHDTCHLPLLANKHISNFLIKLGYLATDYPDQLDALSKLYWKTIEFGVVLEDNKNLKAYGAGLISSKLELKHSIINQSKILYTLSFLYEAMTEEYPVDRFQPYYFSLSTLEELSSEILEELIIDTLKSLKINNINNK